MTLHAFQIRSSEGLPIRGVLHLPQRPRCTVVLVHGFKGFKDWGFFPWIADRLANAGFAACRFDMSRSGIGDRPGQFDRLDLFADDTYSIERADLVAVVRHLETIPEVRHRPLNLFGHSRGAGVAILAAAEVPRLEGVISWNGISNPVRWDGATLAKWRHDGYYDIVNARTGQVMRISTGVLDDLERNPDLLDIRAATRRLSAPLLIIHGGSDETVPLADAGVLWESAPESSLVVIGVGTHTFGATHPLGEISRELALAMKLTEHFVAIRCRHRHE